MATGVKKFQTGRLRIVAGIWRSRLLQIADVPGLRPTGERIRETLFNWLSSDLPGARCLDLCAGSGVLGLEALSRGAASAVFVEKSRHAAQVLRRNIESLDAEGTSLEQTDARRYLAIPPQQPFDLVFLDPPFAGDMLAELCRLLEDGSFLVDDARIYLEMDKGRPLPELPATWGILKDKSTGNVRYLLLRVERE